MIVTAITVGFGVGLDRTACAGVGAVGGVVMTTAYICVKKLVQVYSTLTGRRSTEHNNSSIYRYI